MPDAQSDGHDARSARATAKYPLSGIVGIPQTPFLPTGEIDCDSFERGVHDRVAAGVSALMVPVVASEVHALTREEREMLLSRTTEIAQDHELPVIAGTSGGDFDDALSYADFASRKGCAGILVESPRDTHCKYEDLRSYFRNIAEAADTMLMIQDLDWDGTGLPIDTILRLFEDVPHFRCIKVETRFAGAKYTSLLRATSGDLHVSGGWAVTHLIEALDRGIDAIAAGGNHWSLVDIVSRYSSGDREGARRAFFTLLPALVFSHQHIDMSNRFLKEVAVELGIFEFSDLRSPGVMMDGFHETICRELVEEVVALETALGAPGHV